MKNHSLVTQFVCARARQFQLLNTTPLTHCLERSAWTRRNYSQVQVQVSVCVCRALGKQEREELKKRERSFSSSTTQTSARFQRAHLRAL